MPRFFPPHLMAPVVLLIILIWIILVHHFRRNVTIQKFVSETIGDNTPETALAAFEAAQTRLADHLHADDLDPQLRRRIELALGVFPPAATMETQEENRLF